MSDHLAATRAADAPMRAFRDDVRAGAYMIGWWPSAAPDTSRGAEPSADLKIGLTDASLVVLADRVGTVDVATFDERHFRVVRPIGGTGAFRILPVDARS